MQDVCVGKRFLVLCAGQLESAPSPQSECELVFPQRIHVWNCSDFVSMTQKRRLILLGASRVHKVKVLEMEGRLWTTGVTSVRRRMALVQHKWELATSQRWSGLQGRKIRKGTRVSKNQSITNLSLKCDWSLPCHMLERPAQLIWL